MSEEHTDLASERKAITVTVAERYGMEADTFEVALRNTVFLEGSRAEYAAFLVVCNEYKLNPLTKEIYAFKNKQTGKIVPVVSVDGWVTLCNTHPAFDGITFEDHHSADDGKLYSITATIYRKDRNHPTVITEYLSECIRDTAPWKMQHRMLRHKALQQCARYAFGFSGIYDQDEAERIEITDVTALDEDGAAKFADAPKPPRKPRKAETPVGSNEPGEGDKAPQASQEPAGGADIVEDAQFEDIEEERPTTGAADTAMAGAQTADFEPDTSASAGGASEASQEQMESSQQEPSQGTGDGSIAPRDAAYILTTDEPGEDGKVPVYINGVESARAKPEAKACPDAFDQHPGPAVDTEEQEEDADFDDADPVSDAIKAIRTAKTFEEGEEAMKALAAMPGFKENVADDRKRGVRLALWTRYTEPLESETPLEPHMNFTLMRLFLEFGAKSGQEIDVHWPAFYRTTYRSVNESNQRAINDLMVKRKQELAEARS